MTDLLGRTVGFARDDAGRITAQTLPDGRVIQFAWDENDNLVGLTPPGRPEHLMDYGPVDEMESYDPPDVGLPLDMTSYAYNLDRQLTQITRPDGATVDLSYQEDGRLQNILHDDDSITLSHDDQGHVTAIASVTDETRLDYEYDGPLLTGETLSGPFFGRVGFGYNKDFQLESMDVTGQAPVEYLHDDDGQLIQAGDLAIARDPASGLVTATTLGKLQTQRPPVSG